ncbi:protein TMEPAI-like [Stigmatopora argus]
MRRLRVRARARAVGVGNSHHRRRRPGGRLMRNPAAHLRSSSPAQSNGYCSCTEPQPQGMDISELELVQIILILLAMSVTAAVIVCLLVHYRLLALSLLGRLGHAREVPPSPGDSGGWTGGVPSQRGQGRTGHGPGNRSTLVLAPPLQSCRLQPAHPYLAQDRVGLPPMIRLPNGAEKDPGFYLGHAELKRSCIRAPPNRTVFVDNFSPGGGKKTPPQSPPPSYSVTIEHSPGKMADRPPKRLQTSWHAAGNTTSTRAVPHNSSVT